VYGLNGVKYAVMNSKYAILNDTPTFDLLQLFDDIRFLYYLIMLSIVNSV